MLQPKGELKDCGSSVVFAVILGSLGYFLGCYQVTVESNEGKECTQKPQFLVSFSKNKGNIPKHEFTWKTSLSDISKERKRKEGKMKGTEKGDSAGPYF